jgi:tetratricopeptide (TPR) repeat protein
VAIIRATLGDAAAAGRIVGELDSIPQGRVTQTYMCHRPDIVRIAVAAGDLGLAERAVGGVEPPYPYAEHALVAARAVVAEARRRFDEALADYRDAAARWATFTIPLEQGFALLGEGRCLAALGRHAEAGEALAHARSIFEGLGATALLPELEAAEQAAATTPGDLAAKS